MKHTTFEPGTLLAVDPIIAFLTLWEAYYDLSLQQMHERVQSGLTSGVFISLGRKFIGQHKEWYVVCLETYYPMPEMLWIKVLHSEYGHGILTIAHANYRHSPVKAV